MQSKTKAICCFLINDDEVLLAQSNYRPGKITWNGITGFVEGNEKAEETAVRHLYKDIKLRVYPHDIEQAGVIHFYDIENNVRHKTLEITLLLCEKWQGEPTRTPGIQPAWFDSDIIPYTDMFEDTLSWLPQVLAGQKVIVEVLSTSDPQHNEVKVQDVLVREIL